MVAYIRAVGFSTFQTLMGERQYLITEKKTSMITAAIRKLYKVKLLKPSGLYYLAGSVVYHGINLIALMRYAAKSYPQHIAITDDEASITYTGLYEQSVHIGQYLNDKFHLAHGSKAAILCCNHASMIRSVFAIS